MSAQHIVHWSLGHEQPLQNASHTSSPVVGEVIVALALGSVGSLAAVEASVVAPPLLPESPPVEAAPPLLPESPLDPLPSPSPVAADDVSSPVGGIELALAELPNGLSSLLLAVHATNAINHNTPKARIAANHGRVAQRRTAHSTRHLASELREPLADQRDFA